MVPLSIIRVIPLLIVRVGLYGSPADLNSHVKDLIGTSQDAPQSYDPGPSSGTLVE